MSEVLEQPVAENMDPFLATEPEPEKSIWPEKMRLSDIAREQDDAVQMCLLIFYSKKTSTWEKSFAKENAEKQIWRLEHHFIVPPEQRMPSVKVWNLLKKICADRGLDQIDLMQYFVD